jgi:hypothetical protein
MKKVEKEIQQMETLRKVFKAVFGAIEGIAECAGPSLAI